MGSLATLNPAAGLAVGTPIYARMLAAIAEAERVDEVVEFRDRAIALAEYARRAKNVEAERAAQNIRLKAERRAGELLRQLERATPAEAVSTRYASHGGTRSDAPPVSAYAEALVDTGLSRQDANRFERLADIPEPDFEEALARPEPPTTRGLIDRAAHRVNFTGENEWYTPGRYIDLAREAMGGIDLDPASCPAAQEVVRAGRWFGLDDDGLVQPWAGRVWLNPPYAQPACAAFTDKLAAEFRAGEVSAAVLLVNNCTDAAWFVRAAQAATVLAFTIGRIRFVSREPGVESTPPQGQAFMYFGAHPSRFVAAFRGVAWFPPGTPGNG